MEIEILFEKIEMTVNQKMSADEFASWYEDWFYESVDENLLDKRTFTELENLYNDIGYYEHYEELRNEHSSYFGKDKLLEKLIKVLDVIRK